MNALQQAEADLKTAQDEYIAANDEEQLARSKRTAALNRLNEAQKAFDKAVATIRNDSPRDSDWKRQETRREVATS